MPLPAWCSDSAYLQRIAWPGLPPQLQIGCQFVQPPFDTKVGIGGAAFVVAETTFASSCQSGRRNCSFTDFHMRFMIDVEEVMFNVTHSYAVPWQTEYSTPLDVIADNGDTVATFDDGVISARVGDWLRWAGISMQDETSIGGFTYPVRSSGAQLEVRLVYQNLRPWHWVTDTAVRATLKVTQLPGQWGFLGTEFVDSTMQPHEPFDSVFSTAIVIRFVVDGSIGRFSVVNLLNNVASVIVFVGMAKLCTDLVARFLLPQASRFKGVKYEQIPDLRRIARQLQGAAPAPPGVALSEASDAPRQDNRGLLRRPTRQPRRGSVMTRFAIQMTQRAQRARAAVAETSPGSSGRGLPPAPRDALTVASVATSPTTDSRAVVVNPMLRTSVSAGPPSVPRLCGAQSLL